jgi:hypothetical protein
VLSVTPKQCLEARFVFKNDRMMLILTGLVLAVFAGSMVQYGDRIMALMGNETVAATQDDNYSVRSGSSQILDVLSNDKVKGPLVVLSRPSCGTVELTSNNRLSFLSTSDCTGVVEFAYCVDSEGNCEPNAVKINVISVNFTKSTTPETAPETTPIADAPVDDRPAPSAAPTNTPQQVASAQPAPATEAPEIANFSVEMAPPALAAPSLSELVSPSVAVASIRQTTGGLNSASATDQNIATQNSASIGQTASAGPSSFSAPSMGESSNISLGGGARMVATIAPVVPSGLQASNISGSRITQLERGPEALASVKAVPPLSATAESAPLAASPERSNFAPVVVATAQAPSPVPDTKFAAAPNANGPIALIALNRTKTRGAGAGESLNIILSEPGQQSFAGPTSAPAALVPASGRPINVSVMARGPNVAESLIGPRAPAAIDLLNISIAALADPRILRGTSVRLSAPTAGPAIANTGAHVVASQPNQAVSPNKFTRFDTVSRFISVSRATETTARLGNVPPLLAPDALVFSKPAVNLSPAAPAPILQVSLPATPTLPIENAPAQNSACAIELSAQAISGANIELEVSAACKPNQMVTIDHAGLAFSVLTDAQGAASVQLPAMQAEAEITARFADQSTGSTVVTVRDIEGLVRAGVSWQADMNLDLSAIEFGAAIGSEGYISAATPRDYRTSRIKGGGYLLQLGDPSLERGALAEIYTLPLARNQKRGTVALTIVIQDTENVCGQTINANTVRTREGGNVGTRNVRFTVPNCGVVSGQLTLPGAIDDIRIAGR